MCRSCPKLLLGDPTPHPDPRGDVTQSPNRGNSSWPPGSSISFYSVKFIQPKFTNTMRESQIVGALSLGLASPSSRQIATRAPSSPHP